MSVKKAVSTLGRAGRKGTWAESLLGNPPLDEDIN